MSTTQHQMSPVLFFSSTDINDCNPHPWYVVFHLPRTLVWLIPVSPLIPVLPLPPIPTLHTELEGWWGWRATKKRWKLSLNQASKGNFSEEGAWILNRMKKSGEKACGGGGSHSFYATWVGGGARLWGGRGVEEEAWWGEGLDTAISIWKVKACIDELNWAPWPPPPHTHTHKNHVLCCGLKGCRCHNSLL